MDPYYLQRHDQIYSQSQHKLADQHELPQNGLSISDQLRDLLHKIQSIQNKPIDNNDFNENGAQLQIQRKQQVRSARSSIHNDDLPKIIEKQGKIQDQPPIPHVLSSKRYKNNLSTSGRNKYDSLSSSRRKQQQQGKSTYQGKLYQINTDNQIVHAYQNKISTPQKQTRRNSQVECKTNQKLQQQNIKLRQELAQYKLKFEKQCQYVEVLQNQLKTEKSMYNNREQSDQLSQSLGGKTIQDELIKYKSLLRKKQQEARYKTVQIESLQLEITKLIPYKQQKIRFEGLVQQLITRNKLIEERAAIKSQAVLYSIYGLSSNNNTQILSIQLGILDQYLEIYDLCNITTIFYNYRNKINSIDNNIENIEQKIQYKI